MTDGRLELPQGTLNLLILKTLAVEPKHGWGIAERLHQISSATLDIRQGSLYPALHRLEREPVFPPTSSSGSCGSSWPSRPATCLPHAPRVSIRSSPWGSDLVSCTGKRARNKI